MLAFWLNFVFLSHTGITDVHCKGDEIYILKEDSSVLKFRLIPIPKLVASIFHQRKWTLCAELVLCFIKPLSGASKWRCVSRAMLSDLRRHIVDDVVRSKLDMVVSQMVNRDDFIDDQSDVSTIPSPSQAHFANYELLDTGIYVIKNKYAPTRHCEQRLQQPVSEGTYLQDENNSQPKRSLQEVPKGHISNGNQNIRDMNQGDIAMATKGLGASSNEADQRSGYLTTTSHKDASSTGTTVSNDGLLPRRRSSENLNDQDESRSPQTSQHPSSASNSVTAEISNKDTCWSQHAGRAFPLHIQYFPITFFQMIPYLIKKTLCLYIFSQACFTVLKQTVVVLPHYSKFNSTLGTNTSYLVIIMNHFKNKIVWMPYVDGCRTLRDANYKLLQFYLKPRPLQLQVYWQRLSHNFVVPHTFISQKLQHTDNTYIIVE